MGIPVLHLVNRFYVGGSERQFIERLRRHPQGFDPHVACLELSGGNLDDFRALGLPHPEIFPLRRSLLRPGTLLQIARLARFIRRRGIRVVHGTEFITNLIGLLAARLAGARMVVSRVDLGHLRDGFGPWHRRLECWLSRAADGVCANAEAVRKLCIEEEGSAPGRTFVVRNGLDLDRFDRLAAQPLDAPVPEGAPLVAVVANLWPVKGHRTLLDAVARVVTALPRAHFALVGDGPERAFLQQRIVDLGLGRNVTLLGTRYDVPAILARAQAFCLPSRGEGLPNALMEAMAAGLPAIGTAVGGVPELIEDGVTGALAPADDPAALAEKIAWVLSDSRRAGAMGARGRAKIRSELSLEQLAQGHGAVYRAVLSVESPSNVGVPQPSP